MLLNYLNMGKKNFKYRAQELAAFSYVKNSFVILLKNEKVVWHTPGDPIAFYKWLVENDVRDTNADRENEA